VLLAAAGLAVVAVPAQAQNFSDAYNFIKAVKDRDGDKATELLNKPGTIVANTKEPGTGEAALHILTRGRDMTWISFLLSKGARPDIQNRQGNTPLMLAVQIGWLEGAEAFVESGATVDLANDHGETPLIIAVQNRDVPMVRFLLAHGANPKHTDSVIGFSAVDYAKRDGRSPGILTMLQDAATAAH